MPHVHFLDGNVGTINYLMKNIEPEKQDGTIEYYYSGRTVNDEELQKIQKYLLRLEEMEKIGEEQK